MLMLEAVASRHRSFALILKQPADKIMRLLLTLGVFLLLVRTHQCLDLSKKIMATLGEPFIIPCPRGNGNKLILPSRTTNILEEEDAGGKDSWTPLDDGIRLDEAHKEHDGLATCIFGDRTIQRQQILVVSQPQVQLKANDDYFEFTEGQDMTFTCIGHGGSPLPKEICLLLDEKKVACSTEEPIVRWERQARVEDNNKNITCQMNDTALETAPAYSSRKITIESAPRVPSIDARENSTPRMMEGSFAPSHTTRHYEVVSEATGELFHLDITMPPKQQQPADPRVAKQEPSIDARENSTLRMTEENIPMSFSPSYTTNHYEVVSKEYELFSNGTTVLPPQQKQPDQSAGIWTGIWVFFAVIVVVGSFWFFMCRGNEVEPIKAETKSGGDAQEGVYPANVCSPPTTLAALKKVANLKGAVSTDNTTCAIQMEPGDDDRGDYKRPRTATV